MAFIDLCCICRTKQHTTLQVSKTVEHLMLYLWKTKKAFFKDLLEDFQEPKPALITTNKALIKTICTNKSALIIAESALNYSQILIGFYALVSALLVLRFSLNLFKIIQKISIHKKIKYHSATLILVNDEVLLPTF